MSVFLILRQEKSSRLKVTSSLKVIPLILMVLQMEIMSLSMDTLLKMIKEGSAWELYQMYIGIFLNSNSKSLLAILALQYNMYKICNCGKSNLVEFMKVPIRYGHYIFKLNSHI